MEELYELFKQWAYESTESAISIFTAIDKLRNALQTLELIISLDPEKNDAETYRDAVRLILVNGGWLE